MTHLCTPGFIAGGTGPLEWLVLVAVALIVFGPRRLPAIARRIGAELERLRHAADGFRDQLMNADTDDDEGSA